MENAVKLLVNFAGPLSSRNEARKCLEFFATNFTPIFQQTLRSCECHCFTLQTVALDTSQRVFPMPMFSKTKGLERVLETGNLKSLLAWGGLLDAIDPPPPLIHGIWTQRIIKSLLQ